MKRALLTVAALALPAVFSSNSMAFDWTGFYVGVHGGYAAGTDDVRTTLLDSGGSPVAPTAEGSFDLDGFVGGIQVGGNVQYDQFVFGLEGKYSATSIEGDFNFDPARPEAIAGGSLTGLGSISGKAGITFDNTLVYARGGIAATWNDGFANNVFDPAPSVDVATGGDTLYGYVIGVGVEQAVTEQVTVGLDYSYYGFERGDFDMVSSAYPPGMVLDTEPKIDIGVITAGLNFHF